MPTKKERNQARIIEELRVENLKLRENCDEAKIKQLEDEIEELNKEIKSHLSTISRLEYEKADLEENQVRIPKAFEAKIAEQKEKIEEQRLKIKEFSEALEYKKSAIDNLMFSINKLEEQLKSKTQYISELETALKNINNRYHTLRSQLKELANDTHE